MGKEENQVFKITAKKKKVTTIVIIFVLIVAVFGAAFGYSAYKKINSIYKIDSEEEFIECFEDGFSNKPGIVTLKGYALENDITITKTDIKNPDMKMYANKIEHGSNEEKARITNGYNSTIVFDGNGHTIKNLTLTGYCASLFGKVGTNASSEDANITIKNVTFDNLTINGIGSTGALISYLNEGSTATFENVKIINSSITCAEDSPVGGLIGQSSKGKLHIKNCSIENSVITAENATNVGGIAGSILNAVQENSTVADCKNVNTQVKGLKNVGGIIGEYKDTYVDTLGNYGDRVDEERVFFKGFENSGKISATETSAGGIIGNLSYVSKLNIEFIDCKTGTAKVSGTDTFVSASNNVGGILGSATCNESALTVKTGAQITFQNCENNQSVSGGENIGGIVGLLDDNFWSVKVTGSTNNKDITATSKAGGIVGGIEGTIVGGNQFSFTNCKNTGNVLGQGNASYIGGILGYNKDLNPFFENCKNVGTSCRIVGKKYVGGISGQYGTFMGCENSMEIKGNNQSVFEYIGGIVGSGEKSTFTNCSNSGNIMDYTNANVVATYIGGIAGYTNQLVMEGCSNSGTVAGSDCVGGLVGKSEANILSPKNQLKNCSSTGDIYAFGQATTVLENYTNDDVGDVKGKIGVMIGHFVTGERVLEFSSVTANANIYIIGDTDYVGGWCGYCLIGGGEAIQNAVQNGSADLNVSYKIYLSQNVSDICKSNFKYGEKAFNEVIAGFNNPTAVETFTYNEE